MKVFRIPEHVVEKLKEEIQKTKISVSSPYQQGKDKGLSEALALIQDFAIEEEGAPIPEAAGELNLKQIPEFWPRIGAMSEAAHYASYCGFSPGTSNWCASFMKSYYRLRPGEFEHEMAIKAHLEALQLLNGVIEELKKDKAALTTYAQRWVGLLSAGRIRILGSANIPREDGSGMHEGHTPGETDYMHVGAELWTEYNNKYYTPEEKANATPWNHKVLTTFADKAWELYEAGGGKLLPSDEPIYVQPE